MAITLTGGATFVGGGMIDTPAPPPAEFDFSNPAYNQYKWPGDPNATSIGGFDFGDSGNKFYIVDGTYNFREFDMATPYDLSTTSYVGANNRPAYDYSRSPGAIVFNSTGTRLVGQADWMFYTYNLSTPWDITSISSLAKANNLNNQIPGTPATNFNGLDFDSSEDNIYSTCSANVDEIFGFTVNWPNINYNSNNKLSIVPADPRAKGFMFDKTGDRFIISRQGGPLLIYTMTTPYDITTATQTGTYDISGINPVGNGITDIMASDDFRVIFLNNNGSLWSISQS